MKNEIGAAGGRGEVVSPVSQEIDKLIHQEQEELERLFDAFDLEEPARERLDAHIGKYIRELKFIALRLERRG